LNVYNTRGIPKKAGNGNGDSVSSTARKELKNTGEQEKRGHKAKREFGITIMQEEKTKVA